MYISEISPPEIRGTLLVLEEFSIIVGIVVAFWITYGTRYMSTEWSWRLPFLLQILPGLVLGVGIVFLPFSPRWLGSKGRDEEALHALTQLRRLPATDPRVQREWFDIRAEARLVNEISKERHPDLQDGTRTSRMKLELASWADLFKKGCLRRTHVGVGIMFFQQFVGINALIYYSPTLFETMGLNSSMQLIMSGVLNIMQLVSNTPSALLWSLLTTHSRLVARLRFGQWIVSVDEHSYSGEVSSWQPPTLSSPASSAKDKKTGTPMAVWAGPRWPSSSSTWSPSVPVGDQSHGPYRQRFSPLHSEPRVSPSLLARIG